MSGRSKPLSYRVPEGWGDAVGVGDLVRVPLQRRLELAVVAEVGARPDVAPERLKTLHERLHPFPVLTGDLVALAPWMATYYACRLESVLERMVPKAIREGKRPPQYRFLALKEPLGQREREQLHKRAPQQARLYEHLLRQGRPLRQSEALTELDVPASSVQALVNKGLVEVSARSVPREAYADTLAHADTVEAEAFVLTDEQQAAVEAIQQRLSARAFAVQLLHGVTGSGKTEVYLAALERVLREGGSALVLVPEVALTPQTVARLRQRLAKLGHGIVVWHSQLSEGERLDSWYAVAKGEARVVVGARSALFAPLANLRLIVVDEEHEPAYKQSEVPRYHGRDVAVYRARLNNALCLLGSATPSLESLYNVSKGKYALLQLKRRVDDRQLPLMHIVDMRRAGGGDAWAGFSPFLLDKLRDRLDKGQQSILFLNRRGFDTSLRCPHCGYVARCDHCDVTLTHHKSAAELRCHFCGDVQPVPKRCPQCNSPELHHIGLGTEKAEAHAQRLLPGARIARLDSDTLRERHTFREILEAFRRGKIDVLIGTQMIAKGLDFPNVTLVGLLDADLSLHLPDFRAAERTFQLLVQVSGRAGRGAAKGEVVVQTWLPHASTLLYARAQDFDGFLAAELEQREEFRYPPCRHLIHHLFRGRNPDKVRFYAEQWARRVEAELVPQLPDLEVRGPAPCPLERLRDHYRFQVWYFTQHVTRLVPLLERLREAFPWDDAITEVLDVDAVDVL